MKDGQGTGIIHNVLELRNALSGYRDDLPVMVQGNTLSDPNAVPEPFVAEWWGESGEPFLLLAVANPGDFPSPDPKPWYGYEIDHDESITLGAYKSQIDRDKALVADITRIDNVRNIKVGVVFPFAQNTEGALNAIRMGELQAEDYWLPPTTVDGPCDNSEFVGECDTCGTLYRLADRSGRCGECGNCEEHCKHVITIMSVVNALRDVAPNCTVGQDLEGQVLVYTDLKVNEFGNLVSYDGED